MVHFNSCTLHLNTLYPATPAGEEQPATTASPLAGGGTTTETVELGIYKVRKVIFSQL